MLNWEIKRIGDIPGNFSHHYKFKLFWMAVVILLSDIPFLESCDPVSQVKYSERERENEGGTKKTKSYSSNSCGSFSRSLFYQCKRILVFASL